LLQSESGSAVALDGETSIYYVQSETFGHWKTIRHRVPCMGAQGLPITGKSWGLPVFFDSFPAARSEECAFSVSEHRVQPAQELDRVVHSRREHPRTYKLFHKVSRTSLIKP